jgi:Uma2 family endonuclease
MDAMATSPSELRHLRRVKPLLFPASDPEWEMSESMRHGRLCDLLYHLIRHAVGDGNAVGNDLFLYFDASDPGRKCAPDVFVKLGVPHALVSSWKSWEGGAPELAVEILSPSDTEEKLTWKEKMARYHAIGVKEIASFNVDAKVGSRLRAWDRIEGDLIERKVKNETTPCLTLRAHWVIVPAIATSGEPLEAALRLARDTRGKRLLLTAAEDQAQAAKEEATAAKERATAAEERATAAEAELKRLRAALARAKR